MSEQRITGRNTVWEHKSKAFRVDELTVESDKHPPIQWASFERGDAVAALILNRDTAQVLLVEQFRPPIAAVEGAEHKLIETVAGMVRQNEEVLHCLRREVAEETGYELRFDPQSGGLHGVEFICEFYPSPGGSSEKIHLFYVEIDSYTPKSAGGGLVGQGEFIEPVLVPIDTFFERVHRGDFKDPKLMIAGLWLEKRWANRRTEIKNKHDFGISGTVTSAGKPRIIGYYTGDIGNVRDVDIWVNSTNTQFLLDSIHGTTLSARIRFLGAEKVENTIVDDKIQRAVEYRLGMGKGMRIGNVLDTDAGCLSDSHKVRRLFHVATAQWVVDGDRFRHIPPHISEIVDCVTRILETCDELNAQRMNIDRRLHGPYRSILLPLLGVSMDFDRSNEDSDPQMPEGKKEKSSLYISIQKLCGLLIPLVIRYLETHPNSLIERVYFLGYSELEAEICDSLMSRHTALTRLGADGTSPAQSGARA